MSIVLGIDLGTTKSVVGIWEGGKPRILTSESGSQSIPSLVMITPDEEIYAGVWAAKHPDRYNSKYITISSIKRMIGNKGETSWGWWKSYPQEVSSFILSELKQRAETLLECEANEAVIAIPSHFDEAQRRAIKEAATIAGIKVCRLLNEATAAVLAYGFSRQVEETVVVFDLGGGTLDVSVAEIGNGLVEIKTIEGDSKLGGDDFTQAIINYATDHIRRESGAELANDAMHSLMLREVAEAAKIDLSSGHSTTLYIPGFLSRGSSYADLRVKITRDTFDILCKPMFDKAIGLLDKALQRSGVRNPDALLLLGGSSRIPSLRQRIRNELGVTPFTGVDPETCVAQGAIILAGVLTGAVQNVLLLDVMPSSYGVGIKDGGFKAIIEKDTTIPTKRKEFFTTTADNQTTIGIDLFCGDSEMCSENTYVGHIKFDGIPPAEMGVPQIEFMFNVDSNMIVHASARDLGTGKKKEVVICSPFGLSELQIKMMAKRHKLWKERSILQDLIQQVKAIQYRFDHLLRQNRKLLDCEDIDIIDDCLLQLELATQKEKNRKILKVIITNAEAVVYKIKSKVRKLRSCYQEIQELTMRIDKLNSLALGEYARECDTLNQGLKLMEEYKSRGATAYYIDTLLDSIRWSYCDLISKLVVSLLHELHDSDEFRNVVRLIEEEPVLTQKNSDSLFAGCLACMPVSVLINIFKENQKYVNEIIIRVGNITDGDHTLSAVWFFVCYVCGWKQNIRYPTKLTSDTSLASCCASVFLNMFDTEPSKFRRKSVAEAFTRLIPPEVRFEHLVRSTLKEPDTDIQACLISHIERASTVKILEWFLKADADAKGVVRYSVPLIRLLCKLPESNCRDYAIIALVDLNNSEAISLQNELMLHQDDMLRAAIYRAIFSKSEMKLRTASVIKKSLNDPSLKIRLMGLERIALNPTVVDTDTILQVVKADPSEEMRGRAVKILSQQYGEAGQLGLLSVALEEETQEISRLALDGVIAVQDRMDRDLTRLLSLIRKLIEKRKGLSMMDRCFCRSLIKKRPATRSLVALMINHS